MTAPPGDSRFLLVSDQHLGAPVGAQARPQAYDDAFAEMVEGLVADRDAGRTVALVLLGDFVDLQHRVLAAALPGTPTRRAVGALLGVAAEHPVVFQALGRAVRGGVDVHVVAGNHDADLLRPRVWRALRDLIGDSAGQRSRLQVHPWLLHVPGVLLAEHGHRHHDINRDAHPTQPFLCCDPAAPLGSTPARALAAVKTRRHATAGKPQPTAVLRPVARAALGAFRRGRPPVEAEVEDLARQLRLPAAVVAELLQSPPVLPGLAVRMARNTLPASAGVGVDYLVGSVRRTVETLARGRVRVPVYVTGHTHRASVRNIHVEGSPTATLHVDSGTWSPHVRAVAGRPAPAGPTCVDVGVAAGDVGASLRTWVLPGG